MNFLNNTISDIYDFLSELIENKDFPTLSLLLEHIKENENECEHANTLCEYIHELIKENFEILDNINEKGTSETIELDFYTKYAKASVKDEQKFDFDWCYETQNYEVYFDTKIETDYTGNPSVDFDIQSVFLPYTHNEIDGYINVTTNVNVCAIIDKLSEMEKYDTFTLQNPDFYYCD